MFIAELGVSVCLVFWVFGVLVSWALGIMRSTEGPKSQRSGRVNGFIPSSVRAISSYLRTVSSGASTVARSAASVASSMVDKDGDGAHDQVWGLNFSIAMKYDCDKLSLSCCIIDIWFWELVVVQCYFEVLRNDCQVRDYFGARPELDAFPHTRAFCSVQLSNCKSSY